MADFSGLEYLRNLEVLVLEGQCITDISPVFKLKKLKYLSLGCNFIESVEGIKNLPGLVSLGYDSRLESGEFNVKEHCIENNIKPFSFNYDEHGQYQIWLNLYVGEN